MNKEDFKQRVMENIIFNELKDGYVTTKYLRGKYQGLNIDYYNLFKRIVNYQIKTYGEQIGVIYDRIPRTSEEIAINCRNERVRRYYRRNRG